MVLKNELWLDKIILKSHTGYHIQVMLSVKKAEGPNILGRYGTVRYGIKPVYRYFRFNNWPIEIDFDVICSDHYLVALFNDIRWTKLKSSVKREYNIREV